MRIKNILQQFIYKKKEVVVIFTSPQLQIYTKFKIYMYNMILIMLSVAIITQRHVHWIQNFE